MVSPNNTLSANPSAPEFTPDEWNKNYQLIAGNGQIGTIFPGANCFQYAFAGSAPDGRNNVYHELIPNPGHTGNLNGFMLDDDLHSYTGLLNALSADGFAAAGKNEVPPPKPGHYVVGVYLHEGEDFHFVRQDRDGGWSSKEGIDIPVTRYLEPDEHGNYRPLHGRFGQGDYMFVGYVYVPEQGVNLGMEVPIAQSLKEHPDGAALKDYFRYNYKSTVDDTRAALVLHSDAEIVQRFDEARQKYTPVANPDAPAFEPNKWNLHVNLKGSNSFQYAYAGSDVHGDNNIFDEVPPNPGNTAGYAMPPKAITQSDTEIMNLLGADGLPILPKDKLPPHKSGSYAVGIYIDTRACGQLSEMIVAAA